MMRRTVSRAAWFVLAVVLAVVVAGNALAYWTGGGNGSGETRLSDPLPLTLRPGTPSAQLYPGGDASVAAVVSNPNPYEVRLAAMRLDTSMETGGFGVDDEHRGCDVSSLAFTEQDNGGDGWMVPPKTGTSDGRLPVNMAGALRMGADAGTACQGAVFTVHLVVSG